MEVESILSFSRILLVAPHPDDETIGAGIFLRRNAARAAVIHLTQGCPQDPYFYESAGFRSPHEYREARMCELDAALCALGISPSRRWQAELPDRAVQFHIESAVRHIELAAGITRPQVILSPAYEGGHPDHDSAALATAVVCRRSKGELRHFEYTLYHAGPDGELVTGVFLNNAEDESETLTLTEAEVAFKAGALELFGSQQPFLQRFRPTSEQFREAPPYDFSQPPHPGRLLYERWWNLESAEWRRTTAAVWKAEVRV